MRAIDVAEFLLYRANQDGELITNLKMQKLLYYAQAWFLVNFNKPLFDDPIEAWELGPVIREVYEHYKKFTHTPIIYNDRKGQELKNFSEEELEFLNDFYDKFIGTPAHILVNMTHNEEPWINAFATKDTISLNDMKDYYTKKYEEQANKQE